MYLLEPTASWRTAFLEMAAECATFADERYRAALIDFDSYLARIQQFAQGINLPPERVRETIYWGVDAGQIVGSVRLRHHLTPALQQFGGHIGYDVRPTKRQQGYGTQLLALTLIQARQIGLSSVLLTCDVDNVASARIIEKNGGLLLDQGWVPGYAPLVARYQIDLTTTPTLAA